MCKNHLEFRCRGKSAGVEIRMHGYSLNLKLYNRLRTCMPVMLKAEVVDVGGHHVLLEDAALGLSPLLISQPRRYTGCLIARRSINEYINSARHVPCRDGVPPSSRPPRTLRAGRPFKLLLRSSRQYFSMRGGIYSRMLIRFIR
jgi:hypothetical protein